MSVLCNYNDETHEVHCEFGRSSYDGIMVYNQKDHIIRPGVLSNPAGNVEIYPLAAYNSTPVVDHTSDRINIVGIPAVYYPANPPRSSPLPKLISAIESIRDDVEDPIPVLKSLADECYSLGGFVRSIRYHPHTYDHRNVSVVCDLGDVKKEDVVEFFITQDPYQYRTIRGHRRTATYIYLPGFVALDFHDPIYPAQSAPQDAQWVISREGSTIKIAPTRHNIDYRDTIALTSPAPRRPSKDAFARMSFANTLARL